MAAGISLVHFMLEVCTARIHASHALLREIHFAMYFASKVLIYAKFTKIVQQQKSSSTK